MKGLVTNFIGKIDPHIIEDYEIPEINSKQVRVKTLQNGICGTDFDVMRKFYGGLPKGYDYLVLGHETLGEVVDVGKDVERFSRGDLVVPTVRRSLCDCYSCKEERYDMCLTGRNVERGLSEHGFASEYFNERPEFLVKVDQSVKNRAVLTEPTSIVEKALEFYRASRERLPYKMQSERILIFGAGTVGQMASRIFNLEGYDVTVAALNDESSKVAELARRSGAYVQVNDKLMKLRGERFDGIIEAAGAGDLVLYSVINDILDRNGTLVTLGLPQNVSKVTIDANDFMKKMVVKNLDISGIINSSRKPHFEMALKHLKQIRDARELITHSYNIGDYQDAFEAFQKDEDRVKVVLNFR